MSPPDNINPSGLIPKTADQEKFLKEHVYQQLSYTKDTESLKHLADVWWNLCNWEKQRADVLDNKAQGLLGLSSIAGTLISIGATTFTDNPLAKVFLGFSVLILLATAILTILTLQVSKYGSFLQEDVFGAISLNTKDDPSCKFDRDPFKVYLRDTIIQRWLVYDSYRTASEQKAIKLDNAQTTALIALIFLVLSFVIRVVTI